MPEYIETSDYDGELNVYMMGSISVEFNGRLVPFAGNASSRMLQLFLILLYCGEEGIYREELLDMLYGSGDSISPAGNLRATVFRLRKLLEQYGFPEYEYIRTDGGIYRWDSGDLKVFIDARCFEETAGKALEEKDEEQLKKACGLYKGEFLSQLAGEKWVSVIAIRLQELYFKCIQTVYGLMRQTRAYEELLELCSAACELYPYEECQIMKIDCLIAMKRFREAMQVYNRVVSGYFEEQGLPPSEKMLERFRLMSGQIRYSADTLRDVEESLYEKGEVRGAYYCSYPAFIDCFRLLVRMEERSNFGHVLLCFTLLNAKGKPLDAEGELLKTASEMLAHAISDSLRKGDLYTCYNPGQYLVMLGGASRKNCSRIYERIERKLRQWDGGRRVTLNYQIMYSSIV